MGFPPHRTGGLTKYAFDLMKSQADLGHKVFALYPGNFSMYSRDTCFRKEKSINNIEIYKLENAMPVSLMYGVSSAKDFFCERRICGFNEFIKNVQPDVLHVHTLMGMPRELLMLFHSDGIRIVYTTHDYFGICLRVNLLDRNGNLCLKANETKCAKCCMDSPSLLFLKVRNSKLILSLKKMIL